MARWIGRSVFTQSGRDSGGFNVEWNGVAYVQEQMAKIADGLTWSADGKKLEPRKTAANRELRHTAGAIAKDVLIPQMKRTARSSPVPIARAMAETARAKSDRVIAVQVGGVNPPLSGFKRGVGIKRANGRVGGGTRKPGGNVRRDATSRTFRTTLAWGSEFGPLGGRRQPTRGANTPAGAVNHYKVQRRFPKGYWVLPAVEDVRVKARDQFRAAVDDVVNKYTRMGR